MVTVGSIWGGTIRFVRANIGAILVWSGLIFLFTLLSNVAMASFYQARLATLQSGTPVAPNFGAFGLMMLLGAILFVTLWAATFRAVFFPEQRRFAYLRFGMDELRLLGTVLAIYLGGYILILIVGAILIGVAYAIGGVTVAGIVGAILLCAIVWAVIRISPAGPMTILQRQVVIGPAWRLTRGAFWRLFGAFLLLGIAFVVIYGGLALAQMGSVLADMAHPTDPAAATRVAEWQAAHYSGMSVRWIVIGLISSLMGGVGMAFQAGMIAVATRDLLGMGGENLRDVFE